jgi:hypothetical protein
MVPTESFNKDLTEHQSRGGRFGEIVNFFLLLEIEQRFLGLPFRDLATLPLILKLLPSH